MGKWMHLCFWLKYRLLIIGGNFDKLYWIKYANAIKGTILFLEKILYEIFNTFTQDVQYKNMCLRENLDNLNYHKIRY